jgi:Cu-Zn family superoxide dismutase
MRARSTMAAVGVVALLGVAGAAPAGGAPEPTLVPPGGAAVVASDVPATTFLFDHDGAWIGTADFVPVPDGLFVSVYVEGQRPGPHGLHVHDRGDCGDTIDPATGQPVPFGAAGGHFDPDATADHGAPDDPATMKHAGDLGNIVVDDAGVGVLEITDADLTLSGPHSILGRTVVLHADRDDLVTDPAGNSGARRACGVVVAWPPAVTAP